MLLLLLLLLFCVPAWVTTVAGEEHDMFDFSGGAELAGGKFVILRNDAALMEMALAQWALQRACAAGFTPILAPDVAHHAIVSGCGFRPRDESSGSSQVCRGGFCLRQRTAPASRLMHTHAHAHTSHHPRFILSRTQTCAWLVPPKSPSPV